MNAEVADFVRKKLEAPPGFEPGVEVLQGLTGLQNRAAITNSLAFSAASDRPNPPESAING